MKTHYTTVVLGATYYGLGYAAAHPDCLVLEDGQSVGGEFHRSLRPVRVEELSQKAEDCALGAAMKEYGVWKGTFFDQLKAQAAAQVYAARKLGQELELLLDAHLLCAVPGEQGFNISFLTNEGIHEITADNLVDTTGDCISDPAAVRCTARTYNLFTVSMTDTFAQTLRDVCPECCVLEGPLENEKLVQFPVSPDMALTDAYRHILNIWQKAFPDGEEKILFMAEDFDARYEAVESLPEHWVGKRFSNPMESFAEGEMAK